MTDNLFDPSTAPLPPASELQGKPGSDLSISLVRAARILRLRMAGATYEQIAEAEGYSDPATARHTLIRALRRHEADDIATHRAVQNQRIDLQVRTITPLLNHDDPMVKLKASDSLNRVNKRHADLNGLDAPKQVQISAGVLQEMDDAFGQLRLIVSGEVVEPDPPEMDVLEG